MRPIPACLAVLLAIAAPAGAIELQGATVGAWDQYLRDAGLRMQERLDSRKPFLWMDESEARAARIRRGEIVVAPLLGPGTPRVANGLIHHSIVAALIPNATIE